ncbi:amidohydrolase [Actinocatenispora rupis]|uniref:N-acyl-L-amino acid amidohydrolase n=1 Tax=Actinocatenispora rupis TaxID=519421 RepID=A0A8J3NBC2_9ACTN|nr:amidohydrolase [Actinocatenispora rupis]GID10507.1 N-acyl-L-amino acid amidohydrolase [Actinocatenispora rupis]
MSASTLTPGVTTRFDPAADSLPALLDGWLASHHGELVAIRRHLHAHPDLSGEEHPTAAYLSGILAGAGLEPRLLPAGNGVICEVGSGDPVVALRGDIDALPMTDVKDVPYRSTVDGVTHACGHDVHATVVAGAGLALAELAAAGQLPGTVRLLLQPSEERFPSGAPQVVAAGGLADARAVFAFHCDPKLPTGMIGVRSGPLTAAADMLEVRLSGTGGHTARPHLTADVVNALARVVVDVPALLTRRADPRAGLSVVFGAVHAGQAPNAIPREGVARATVRVLDRDAWGDAPELIDQLVRDAVAGTGADVEVDYTRGVPPVVNDRAATAVFGAAAAAALGPDHVVEAPISMGGEDFAWYLEHVPGAMARLGVGRPGEQLDLHQPNFDVDEQAIAHGVRVLVHTALAALADPSL